MGVDLYAGPLQRYYTRRWETLGAVTARELNLGYQLHFEDDNDPLSLDDKAAVTGVVKFADRLQPKLNLGPRPCWNEDFDLPYKTVQLTREGFDSLLIWAAYLHRPELERPRKLPDDPYADPAVAEANDRGYYMGPMSIFEAHMVVPGDEALIASETDSIGRSIIVATSAALDGAIGALAPGLEVDAVSASEVAHQGPPSGGLVLVQNKRKWYEFFKSELRQEMSQPIDDEVREFAKYALSCMFVLSAFAADHRVPILRDE